ncbi:MAG: alpha/beta fold hydrolase [Xanthobacteraceae bacterium]|nr:alpha/beta fold hydrolase [Xanthobacteraceae bacterium]
MRFLKYLAIGICSLGSAVVNAEVPMREFYVGASPYQMYVQEWAAASGKRAGAAPVIMIHGGVHTGSTWTTEPDGKPGWAPRFAEQGWPVYVVDWPGVGRSGFWPETLTTGADKVVDALIALLERTGPAVLMGHSIGGALSFKIAERRPDLVRAIVALAPASMEVPSTSVPAAAPDKPVIVSREVALQRFANSELFPKDSFENYFSSLVPYSPVIRNAAVGVNDDLKLDRSRLDIWKKVPVLFLVAEEDRTVPNALSEQTAKVMGLQQVLLGRDWGMPGHAHLFIIERGNDAIAQKVQNWIATN